MNKKVKYIILGVLLLLIASLVVYFVFIKKDNNTDNIKFSKEYTSVSKDNVFVYR